MRAEDVARKAMQDAIATMKAHPLAFSFCEQHGCGPVETEPEERLGARTELRRLSKLFPDVYREVATADGVDMRGEYLAGPMTLDWLHGLRARLPPSTGTIGAHP